MIPVLQGLVSGIIVLALGGLSMTLDCYEGCPDACRRVDVATVVGMLGGGGSALVAIRPRWGVSVRVGLHAASFALAVVIGLWGLGARP